MRVCGRGYICEPNSETDGFMLLMIKFLLFTLLTICRASVIVNSQSDVVALSVRSGEFLSRGRFCSCQLRIRLCSKASKQREDGDRDNQGPLLAVAMRDVLNQTGQRHIGMWMICVVNSLVFSVDR